MKNTKNFFLLTISLMVFIIFSLEMLVLIINQKDELMIQMNTYLLNRAEKESSMLDSKITEVGYNSRVLAEIISNDNTLKYDYYNAYISERLEEQSMAFGMGYWFEPYYTNSQVEYYGPYIYKDDEGNIIFTTIYSNENYDYTSWDWYYDGVTSETASHFTEPYYDELLNTVFMTISNQIVRDNNVVGIVTIDITLREISEYISSLQIGTNGRGFILTSNGMILGENQLSTIEDLTEDTSGINKELSEISNEIIASNVTGTTVNNGIITVWAPIGSTNMYVVFCYPEKELMTSINFKIFLAVAMFVVSMIIFVLILNITLKRYFENPLRQILKYNTPTVEMDQSGSVQSVDAQPNFDNMLLLISRLFEERNSSINKLNDKNIELEIKNEEIEALYHQTSAMNKTLNQLLDEIRNGYIVTVRSLSNAIEANDKYTKGHCERVTEYALTTAKIFDFSREELTSLEYAAILHDVGKIGIPNSILNKTDKLTEDEIEIVRQHPKTGYEILKDIKFLENSIDIVLHHHERVDGNGYPNGLTVEEIALSVKILTVADAYDAMTSSRPYRKKPYTKEEAIEILRNNSGTQFDTDVVRVFINMIKNMG